MRRHYLDNIRWITVGLVVLYHVIFMYNGGSDRAVLGGTVSGCRAVPAVSVVYGAAVSGVWNVCQILSGRTYRPGISCGKNEKASGALDDRPVRVLVDTGVFQHGIQPCV